MLIAVGRDHRRIELLPPIMTIFLFVAAVWTGVVQSLLQWSRRVNPTIWSLTPRPARAAWMINVSLIGALVGFGFLLFGLVPEGGTAASWVVVAGGIVAVGAYLSWGGAALLRRAGIIRPAPDRLQAIVSRVAQRMNVQPRSVDELLLPMANAFAFVASWRIGVTSAALAILSDDELSAVCAHELGHLSESRWVRVARILSVFVTGGWIAMPATIRAFLGPRARTNALLVFWICWFFLLLYLLLYLRLVRRMEVRADALGRQLEPAPGTYARALEKIYAANLVPVVVASKRMTHPELYDRLVEAGAQPEYPRPAAPPSWPRRFGLLTIIGGSIAAGIGLDWLARVLAN
jgi:Zn-dependent protease with chaperone function